MLDVWPALPIIISPRGGLPALAEGEDNIIAALRRHDRACEITLWSVPSLLLERFAAAMQDPFPALTRLELCSSDRPAPALPNSFLGGSAPRLRKLYLSNVPFPAVWKLTLPDLVHLHLWDIPLPGYVSPEAMATCLSAMTGLESLRLGFRHSEFRPDPTSQRLPPLTRILLPNLTRFRFKGACEYLEDLVARIDAPLLHIARIIFFDQSIFTISQLPLFIGRTGMFEELSQADIALHYDFAQVTLSPQKGTADRTMLALEVLCVTPQGQISSLVQVCSSLPLLSNFGRLDIRENRYRRPLWEDDVDNSRWLDVLRPFAAVEGLYLTQELALRLAPILRELAGASVTNVLPAMRNLFVKGPQPWAPVEEAIGPFIAARRVSDRPVAVRYSEIDREDDD
jgi:hypothetical protein